MKNPITSALICAGLEPMDSWEDLKELIQKFREQTDDDIVIYTGYNKDEINERVKRLSQYKNIIIKFGRYVAGQSPHFDNVLGVNLISDNQYAEKIS
jgi:transcriptional regulatory protein LevR